MFNLSGIFKCRFSIKYKLLVSYILVITIPVLIGSYIPLVFTQKIIIKEADKTLQFSLQNISDSVKYKMVKYNRIMNRIVTDYELGSTLSADFTGRENEAHYAAYEIYDKILKAEMKNNDEEIISMKIYKKNKTLPKVSDILLDEKDYENNDWFKKVYRNKGISYWKYGAVDMSDRSMLSTISLISPIRATNSVGLLEIQLNEKYIFDSIGSFNYKKESVIFVTDETGNIIFKNPQDDSTAEKLFPKIQSQVLSSDSGSFTNIIDGDSYLILNRELNFQGWQVVVIIPVQALYENINTIRLFTFLTVLSCIIISLFITLFLANIMTSRLQKLARRMQSVKDGNFDVTMTVKGNDEITELSQVFNSMVGSIKNLIEEVYANKIKKKEAELRALQEQINPHFLYNTLSSINWLAVQANAPQIVDMIESLALFYRMSLNKGREVIPLKDEILQAGAYVSIQKIRYENSFQVYFDVEPGIENAPIIKLIIQPFIENAIIHGFNEEMQGSIYVTANKRNDNIVIKVIDNGKGIDKEKVKTLLLPDQSGSGKGYGMRNVNERIKIHYGEAYGISIESELQEGTIVEITLPDTSNCEEGHIC